jgi:hypothetical protein
VGSKIVVVVVSQSSLLNFFLFVICDCVGDAAGVGAPVMCVVRWGRGSSKGSLVIHKLCFVWGWMLVYRAEFEAVQLRVYDRQLCFGLFFVFCCNFFWSMFDG